MKNLKKVAALCVAALSLAAVAAQTSKTNTATAGNFGTDVDNYMDVNSWQTVQPKNMFGFFGFSGTNYDLGLAKQFKKFYGGLYYDGSFGKSTSTTNTTTDANTTSTSNTVATDSSNLTNFSVGAIYGVKNIGVKLYSSYKDGGSSTTPVAVGTGSTVVTNTAMVFGARVGYNTSVKKTPITPYADISYASNVNMTETNSSVSFGTDTLTTHFVSDNSLSTFTIGLGSGFALPKLGQLEQSARLDTSFAFISYPATASVNTVTNSATGKISGTAKMESGKSANAIAFIPAYSVKFAPSDKIGLKATVKLPVSFSGTKSSGSITMNYDTGKSAADNSTSLTTVTFTPYFSVGSTYQFRPNIQFHIGADFDLCEYSHASSTVSGTDTTSTTKINSCDGSDDNGLKFTSGFAFNPSKQIALDCSWDILQSILGSTLASKWNTASTADGFWGNVNTIVFSAISVQATIKL